MLLYIVLVIGGGGLLAGPVQATVKSFEQIEGLSTGSFLCPNKTQTYKCEVSGTKLQWISTDIDRETVDIISFSQTFFNVGFMSNQSEFSFTWTSNTNGAAGTASFYSSVNVNSTRLECRDGDDMMSIFARLNVKDPLDNPAVNVSYSSDNVAEVTWDKVDCAEAYVVEIPDLGVKRTLKSTVYMYTTPFLQTGVTYHGRVYAIGGAPSQFTVIGVNISTINFTFSSFQPFDASDVPSTPTKCFDFSPVYKILSNKFGYALTFINFPEGGIVYYETSSGDRKNVTVENKAANIFEDSNVTVVVAYPNGTKYCSETVPGPGSVLDYAGYVILILFLILVAAVLGASAAVPISIFLYNKKEENKVCCGAPLALLRKATDDKKDIKQ